MAAHRRKSALKLSELDDLSALTITRVHHALDLSMQLVDDPQHQQALVLTVIGYLIHTVAGMTGLPEKEGREHVLGTIVQVMSDE